MWEAKGNKNGSIPCTGASRILLSQQTTGRASSSPASHPDPQASIHHSENWSWCSITQRRLTEWFARNAATTILLPIFTSSFFQGTQGSVWQNKATNGPILKTKVLAIGKIGTESKGQKYKWKMEIRGCINLRHGKGKKAKEACWLDRITGTCMKTKRNGAIPFHFAGKWSLRKNFWPGPASGSSRVKAQTPRERLLKLFGLLTYKVWLRTSGLPISCLQNGNGSRTRAAVRIKSVNMCVALRTALHKVNNMLWWGGRLPRGPTSLLEAAWIQDMGSPLLPSRSSQILLWILLWKFSPQLYAEVTTGGATVIKNNAWPCLSTSCQGPGPFLESGGPAQEPARHSQKPAILQTPEARSLCTYRRSLPHLTWRDSWSRMGWILSANWMEQSSLKRNSRSI